MVRQAHHERSKGALEMPWIPIWAVHGATGCSGCMVRQAHHERSKGALEMSWIPIWAVHGATGCSGCMVRQVAAGAWFDRLTMSGRRGLWKCPGYQLHYGETDTVGMRPTDSRNCKVRQIRCAIPCRWRGRVARIDACAHIALHLPSAACAAWAIQSEGSPWLLRLAETRGH